MKFESRMSKYALHGGLPSSHSAAKHSLRREHWNTALKPLASPTLKHLWSLASLVVRPIVSEGVPLAGTRVNVLGRQDLKSDEVPNAVNAPSRIFDPFRLKKLKTYTQVGLQASLCHVVPSRSTSGKSRILSCFRATCKATRR